MTACPPSRTRLQAGLLVLGLAVLVVGLARAQSVPLEVDAGPAAPSLPASSEAAPAPPPATMPPDAQRSAVLTDGSTIAPADAAEQHSIDVTVVGQRIARTAGSAHVLSSRQLQRFEYDDATAVLLSVPGVYARGEDGMGLRPNLGFRGVNPDRSKKVTLMEDGILFAPAPYSAPAAYFFPLITRMAQVRVIKGPAAISEGPQTVAGAVDLVTRPIPDDLGGGVDVAAGQYGYGKAHVYAGATRGGLGLLVEGVRLQNNGFKELPSGADTGAARNEWMVKSKYAFQGGGERHHELRLKLGYSSEVSNETYLGLSDTDFRANPNQRYAASQLDRMENSRTAIALTHVLSRGTDLTLTTSIYRNDYARSWRKVNGLRGADIFEVLRYPSGVNQQYQRALRGESNLPAESAVLIGPNARDFLAAGADTRLRWTRCSGRLSHRLELGARYHYDAIERHHSQSGFVVDDGQLAPDGAPAVVTAFNKAYTHALALHASYALSVGGLILTPGLRTELLRSGFDNHIDRAETRAFETAVLPGLGLYYGLTRALGVLAGVYRGFSPAAPGQASAEPELSVNYEAGARYMHRGVRLEGIGFFNDYGNITSTCTASSSCPVEQLDQQYNNGRARIYGAEALAEQELPIGAVRLPVLVAYTFTRAEFRDAFESADPTYRRVGEGDAIPYVPRHQLRAQVGIEHTWAALNLAVTYVAPTAEITESEARESGGGLHTDEQLVFDLSGSARIWGPLSLYANALNLLDRQSIVARRPFGARPNAPRWIQAGIKATF